MADAACSSTQIQLRLGFLPADDKTARDELLRVAYERLSRLARKMLQSYPGVRRWAQTEDILQSAALRLWRSLEQVRPESVRGFISLAAVQTRRELIDLARYYDGLQGSGRHRAGRIGSDGSGDTPGPPDPGSDTDDPARLADWTEFHDQVEALPGEEKEVFDLLWYQGLPQDGAGPAAAARRRARGAGHRRGEQIPRRGHGQPRADEPARIGHAPQGPRYQSDLAASHDALGFMPGVLTDESAEALELHHRALESYRRSLANAETRPTFATPLAPCP
jgi:RNA polymerase sigma factor (sigma-70 family)